MGEEVGPIERAFGDRDATFQACGGEAGIRRLVESFYRIMDTLPVAKRIRKLHPSDLGLSIDKLDCFLCGWTGGPKRYAERFGPIKIPMAHSHLPVGEAERDAWLTCMEKALEEQPFSGDLRRYLLKELFVPAERIRLVVEAGGKRVPHT
jgi:hemoglobin